MNKKTFIMGKIANNNDIESIERPPGNASSRSSLGTATTSTMNPTTGRTTSTTRDWSAHPEDFIGGCWLMYHGFDGSYKAGRGQFARPWIEEEEPLLMP